MALETLGYGLGAGPYPKTYLSVSQCMWRAALVLALLVVACSHPSAPVAQTSTRPSPPLSLGQSPAPASPSPSAPTSSQSASPGTTPSPLSTPSRPPDSTLACALRPAAGDPLILMAHWTAATEPELVVIDAVNPVRPVQECTLSPAAGGRFIAGTRIAFWVGNSLRVADIGTGAVAVTATLPAYPTDGAFSRDGSLFAYRVGDDTNGLSTHLFIAGRDRTLVTRAGIGGHGGPPYGPLSQLEFSADGKYLLSVDSFGAVFASEPPNFVVYDQNGSMVFQSTTAAFGRWAMQGSKLYFLAEPEAHGIKGDLHSWDPVGGDMPIVHGLSSYFWPMVSPDNRRLLFNSYDSAGLPHLWSIDLATGGFAQLAAGISTHPVFVGTSVAWSNEEAPCNCGPGGVSAPDGKLVSHDLRTGNETSFSVAADGHSGANTRSILDVWFG